MARRGKRVRIKGDGESIAIANNPEFLAIVKRSRAALAAGKGIPLDELRRHLGLERRREDSFPAATDAG